jgi:hypothetical protein
VVAGGDPPDIGIPPELEAGVWANRVDVFCGVHEFTLDSSRLNHGGDRPGEEAVLVARVAISAGVLFQLLDLLRDEWSRYAREAMPDAGDSAE